MLEEMRKAMGWFRELEKLGTLDNQTGFQCSPGVPKDRAESVISELVAHMAVLKREWESFSTRISDVNQEDVVRARPNDLKDFYVNQLLPNEPLLVRAYIAALVRQVRDNNLRLINLSPLEEVLASHWPDAPEKRFEVAILAHRLASDLQDVTAIVSDFKQAAEQALNDFDTGRVVVDQLMPVAGRLVDTLPDDYWEREDIDLPLDSLQMRNAMHYRYASHLCDYVFTRSLNDLLLSQPTDPGPDPAGRFLSGVLDYWYDLASDDDRFSDGGDWARQGRMHEQKLYALCKKEAVWQVLDKSFFRPENWQSNLRQLQPIFFGNSGRLNQARRHYLIQVYESFIFGQWSAVFTLARALLEDVVKERLRVAGGEVSYEVNGKRRNKDLEWLIDDLVKGRTELKDIQTYMHNIREQGNKALHDLQDHKASAMVDAEQRFRPRALDVIRQLKTALEALFADSGSTRSL